ncbi:hypothetical protein ACQKQD_32785 [Methylobacterium sp. NPDC080182]|uniref:hypothetical protein n=1 Tax=Methylobacterium sp. NPDC080182 TaxID=3390590 RepID=UPI003D0339BF
MSPTELPPHHPASSSQNLSQDDPLLRDDAKIPPNTSKEFRAIRTEYIIIAAIIVIMTAYLLKII